MYFGLFSSLPLKKLQEAISLSEDKKNGSPTPSDLSPQITTKFEQHNTVNGEGGECKRPSTSDALPTTSVPVSPRRPRKVVCYVCNFTTNILYVHFLVCTVWC